MSNKTDSKKEDEKRRRRIIISSCTAFRYFGNIGKINKETHTTIDDNTNEKERNVNDKLKFDVDDLDSKTIKLKNGDYKIGFTLRGVESDKFTCTTSDSEIATCVIEDGYVRVKPLKAGTITLTVETEVNGIRYIAQTKIKIVGEESSSSNDKDSKTSHSKHSKNKSDKKNSSSKSKSKNKSSKSSSSKSGNNGTGSTSPSKTSGTVSHYEKEKEARLSSLTVNNYKLYPQFNENTTAYIVSVPSNVTSVNINATAKSSKATISGIGNITLTGNSTIAKVVVKSESGNTLTYTIKINKKENVNYLSSDATLKHLSLEGYSLNPTFNKDTLRYNVSIPYEKTAIDVSAIANNENALVTVSGNQNLKVGSNEVRIDVLAENGNSKTYIVNVTRLDKAQVSSNAYLANLVIGNGVLTPTFNKNTYSYTVNVDSNTDKLVFTSIIPEDENSTVSISGNENFTTGNNKVVITVTSKSGVKKDYEINVIKAADSSLSNNTTITNIGVKDNGDNTVYNATPTANPLEYSVTVPSTVSNINITYTKGHELIVILI